MKYFLKNFFLVVSVLSFVLPANAATVKTPAPVETKADYSGTILIKSAESLVMKPGERVKFKVGVKNTGKATWKNTGARFASINTYYPKYRASVFKDTGWMGADQQVKMVEASVAPGAIGYFEFYLKAPAKTGEYLEGFILSAENFAWITGSDFKLPITVSTKVTKNPPAPAPAPTPAPTKPSPAPGSQVASASALAASVMIKSFGERVVMQGGATTNITVSYKNTGSVIWQTRVLRIRGTSIATASTSTNSFMHETWPNSQEPIRIREPISPGNVAFFNFTIQAPAAKGEYTLPLKLVVEDKDIPDTEITIPVTVTEDAPQLPVQQIPIQPGGAEPTIRVGLWKVPSMVNMTNTSPVEIRDSTGNTITVVPAETTILATYDKNSRIITMVVNGTIYTGSNLVKFIPTTPGALFRIPNFAGWDATAYENRFRGSLELTYYQPSDTIWLIEELPLEEYMRGLAETSNNSAYEYQKALIIAARTYAYFVHSIGGKYALFDVSPTAADQVYRAYGSETVRPNVVRAVEETRGMLVTYNNEVVVTPYFSRSDGRTRSWQEVWCCKVKPWLVGVPAPHDVGLQLWGHGVGMSALDASGWARDGKTYDWILKYFYTGIDIKKLY